MTDFNSMLMYLPAGASISTQSFASIASDNCRSLAVTYASAVWPVAKLVLYLPILVESEVTAYQMTSMNGAAVSGNIDLAIMDANGARLVSVGAATAQAGTSGIQLFNVADTVLTPGLYYMAASMDNTTGTLLRNANANTALQQQSCGVMQETTGSFGIPATWTPVKPANAYMPLIGVALRATV